MLRHIQFAILLMLVLMLGVSAQAQEKDIAGSKDHPLVTRMPGYFISSYEVKEFDAMDSPYATGADARWEGRTTRIGYTVQPGGRQVSMIQIARNYEAAAVVAALVGRGIDAARLKAAGVGPYSPVATNRTDDGKSKNRRVELVEQF
jgi:hypothetical protein